MAFLIRSPHRACAAALLLWSASALMAQGAAGGNTAAATGSTGTAPATSSTGAPASASALSRADRDFILQAADDGMAEVELGKLAQQKGDSDAVKTFGSQMFDDHSKANEELRRIAQSKGITLPAGPSSKHQKDMAKLGRASGAAFDRDYARHMVTDHKKAVALFEKQARSGSDADVKAFAAKTLPTLQQHREHAERLASTVKNGKKSGA
jgi:putative membrane protein